MTSVNIPIRKLEKIKINFTKSEKERLIEAVAEQQNEIVNVGRSTRALEEKEKAWMKFTERYNKSVEENHRKVNCFTKASIS